MVWIAPMTAVANAVWTSAQFNTYVRDNMLASEAGTASAANQIIFSTAANTLIARTPAGAKVATSQTTTSTTYADLTTVHSVTVTTGTAAFVHISGWHSSNTIAAFSMMSYAVSGATTIAAADSWSTSWDATDNTNQGARIGMWHYVANLTAGSNTFTTKYRCSTGTSSFQDREIIVIPI